MKRHFLALAVLALASPAFAQAPATGQAPGTPLVQEPASGQVQNSACPPGSPQAAGTGACPETSTARAYDETRGDFGDDERPFSLTEKDWNGE